MTLQPVEQALEEVAAVLDQAWRDCQSTWQVYALVDAWRDVNSALSNIRRSGVEPAQSSNRRLTAVKVGQIRRRRAAGETVARLAVRYCTSEANIRMIVHRRTWKHVP